VLRDNGFRINDFVIDRIAECFGQCVVDDLECAAFVVALEVLYILQDEGNGPVIFEDISDLEKEIALSFILKAVLAPKLSFFETPAIENGWQGKPAQRISCAGMSATATA
jgi:hypothetical protein